VTNLVINHRQSGRVRNANYVTGLAQHDHRMLFEYQRVYQAPGDTFLKYQ